MEASINRICQPLLAGWLISLWSSLVVDESLPAASLVSDESLAARAPGDPEAYGELYRRYLKRVYAYHLVRTGRVADAQDLTSQTFLAALEGIGAYRRQGCFAAWLLSIARRKVADFYRRGRETDDLDTAKNLPEMQPRVEETVERHINLEQLNRALAQLQPERAEALALRVFGQLSAAEVGQIMQKSEGTVRTLVYRALQDLRHCFALVGALEEK